MASLLDTLISARAALLSIPDHPPVLMRGDADPGAGEVVILDRIADTARRHYGGMTTSKLIQVSCYAPTVARALTLSNTARAALTGAGFRFLQSRPAPDPDATGEVSDYAR